MASELLKTFEKIENGRTSIINKLKQKYKNEILITTVNSPVNYCTTVGLPNMKGCIGAQELVAINSDGSVTTCLMNKYDLGNIFDVESITEIYESDKICCSSLYINISYRLR